MTNISFSSILEFLMQSSPPLLENGILLWAARLIMVGLVAGLLFKIFPRQREKILLPLSFIYGVWFLGPTNMALQVLFVSIWWALMRFSSEDAQEKRRALFQWIILVLASVLYFGLMNAGRIGWELPRPSVQELGLSYLYLRVIHVTGDWKRGELKAPPFFDFLNYVFYFPTLMGGPVERYERLFEKPFFQKQTSWKFHLDSSMALRVLGGIAKIAASVTFLNLPYSELWDQTRDLSYFMLVKILYFRAISFYLMVSGTNDITLMFSKSLQIPLLENYDYPYFRRNLAHFWRTWHISLSTILRDYLYEPLGGKRKHQRLNYLITFFFCAMWHVTSPAFVIWGLMHGFGMGILRTWQDFWANQVGRIPGIGKGLISVRDFFRAYPRLSWTLSALITFHFVALAWLPFWGGHPQGTIAIFRLLKLDFLVGPMFD